MRNIPSVAPRLLRISPRQRARFHRRITVLVTILAGSVAFHLSVGRHNADLSPNLGNVTEYFQPAYMKDKRHTPNIWPTGAKPPSEFFYRSQFGEDAPWISVHNPPSKPYPGKPHIHNWKTLGPRQDVPYDIHRINYPMEWDTDDEIADTSPFKVPNKTWEKLQSDYDDNLVVERTMKGVRRHRLKDYNIFGEPKQRTPNSDGEIPHHTTDDFALSDVVYYHSGESPATEELEAVQDMRNPDDIKYESDPWCAEEPTDDEDKYAPGLNELCIKYKPSKLSEKELLEILAVGFDSRELEYDILQSNAVDGFLDLAFVRIKMPGLSKDRMEDIEVERYVKNIRGIWEANVGEIRNNVDKDDPVFGGSDDDLNDEEKGSAEESTSSADPGQDSPTAASEFSEDPERIAQLLRGERDEEGRLYGKEEKSPFYMNRFPGKNSPPQYDMTYIRTEADPTTMYFEGSDVSSAHYSFTGLQSKIYEVKWHHLPQAKEPWIISACGDNNIFAFLNRKAMLKQSVKYHNNEVFQIRWNHVGTRFISASADCRVMFFNADGECTGLKEDSAEVLAVSFDRRSEKVLFGGRSERLNIWELRDGPYADYSAIPLHYQLNWIVTLKDNSSLVLTAGERETVIDVWNINTGRLVTQLQTAGGIRDLRLSLHEDYIVAAAGTRVYMWRYHSPAYGIDNPEEFHKNQGFELAYVRKLEARVGLAAMDEKLGRFVATLDADKSAVRGYNLSSGECVRSFIGHKAPITSLDLGPKGYLVTGSKDKTLKLWPWPTPENMLEIYDEFHAVVPKGLNMLPSYILDDHADLSDPAIHGEYTKCTDDFPSLSKPENRTLAQMIKSDSIALPEEAQDLIRHLSEAEKRRSSRDHSKITKDDVDEALEEMMRISRKDNRVGRRSGDQGAEDYFSAPELAFDDQSFHLLHELMLSKSMAAGGEDDESEDSKMTLPEDLSKMAFSGWDDVIDIESARKQSQAYLHDRAERAAYERKYAEIKRKAQKAERILAKRAAEETLSDSSPSGHVQTDEDGNKPFFPEELSDVEMPRDPHPRQTRENGGSQKMRLGAFDSSFGARAPPAADDSCCNGNESNGKKGKMHARDETAGDEGDDEGEEDSFKTRGLTNAEAGSREYRPTASGGKFLDDNGCDDQVDETQFDEKQTDDDKE